MFSSFVGKRGFEQVDDIFKVLFDTYKRKLILLSNLMNHSIDSARFKDELKKLLEEGTTFNDLEKKNKVIEKSAQLVEDISLLKRALSLQQAFFTNEDMLLLREGLSQEGQILKLEEKHIKELEGRVLDDGKELLKSFNFPFSTYPKLGNFLTGRPQDLVVLRDVLGAEANGFFRFGVTSVAEIVNEITWPYIFEIAKLLGSEASNGFAHYLRALFRFISFRFPLVF